MESTSTLIPGPHLDHIELTAPPIRVDVFPTDELCDVAICSSIVITVRITLHLLDHSLEKVLLLSFADGTALSYRFLTDQISCMTLSVHKLRAQWYIGLSFVHVWGHILSGVATATFFDSIVHALLAAHVKVLSRFLFLIYIFVSVLLVFDFYPIKVLGHIILPPISSHLLLG